MKIPDNGLWVNYLKLFYNDFHETYNFSVFQSLYHLFFCNNSLTEWNNLCLCRIKIWIFMRKLIRGTFTWSKEQYASWWANTLYEKRHHISTVQNRTLSIHRVITEEAGATVTVSSFPKKSTECSWWVW